MIGFERGANAFEIARLTVGVPRDDVCFVDGKNGARDRNFG